MPWGRFLAAEDRVQRRREVLRLGVLGVVDEHAPTAVDVHVELLDQPAHELDTRACGRGRSASSSGARRDQRNALPATAVRRAAAPRARRGLARRDGAGVGATPGAPGVPPGPDGRSGTEASGSPRDRRRRRIAPECSSAPRTRLHVDERTMSRSRRMFDAVSVIMRMFVSRCAMSAPARRDEWADQLRGGHRRVAQGTICVMNSSVARRCGSGAAPMIVGTARSRAPSMRMTL